MVSVVCEILEFEGSPREYQTVAVQGINDKKEFVQVRPSFLDHKSGKVFLPVSFIGNDPKTGAVLIQFPFEADSGANRIWVPRSSISLPEEIPA